MAEPTPTAPAVVPSPPLASTPSPTSVSSPQRPTLRRLLWFVSLLVLVALAIPAAWSWWSYRSTHSITDDAFVEAHIINIAPQVVSGHLVRFLVEENDRVEQGQVLAETDPVLYRDQVESARRKVEGAEAELRRQEAALARLRLEVPIQIEIARRAVAAARADQARAREALKLTEDDVDKGIDEARAGLDAAKVDLVLAQQEYTRFTNLYKEEAVALRRSQEVTRSRDAAEAQRKLAAAKLAKAEAGRTQIDVAKRTLEASEKATQKAEKGVDLAETGNAQIREVELLTAVKKESVTEARTARASEVTGLFP
jgi:membrane fusion protein (multidrug efflux system)